MRGGLLESRTIVVSGVGPGLGRKLALQCAAQGARVALGARSGGFLEEVATEVRAAGGDALAVRCDVTRDEDCRALIEGAASRFGSIDGLVNSAFRMTSGLFEQADLAEWREAMEVNCFGALRLVQLALPHLRRTTGCVVNIGTIGTRVTNPAAGGYNMSKAALDQATRQLAGELGPSGVRVNGALMGWMDGEPLRANFGHRAAIRGITPDELRRDLTEALPLRRFATDDECAGAVIFLLSDLSAAMTGALIHVNGGQFMQA
jgi:NAD(P)-dependent dehydrogenase (short-subunit alcohol dehydrogenase family)